MRRAEWIAWAGVMTLAAIVLLWGLEGTAMRPYDEGLYGRLARNALRHHAWWFAVEPDGSFSTKFSKPPASLWLTAASMRALGPSMLSLRLPFALCAWLGIGVCTAWGARARGIWFGVAWGLTLTLCGASLRWGRYASIEPMFVAFGLAALWAQAEALVATPRRAPRWALVAGLALTLAWLTKQLAVGLFVLPVLCVEIVAWRRGASVRAIVRRSVLVLGVPAVLGGAWLVAAMQRAGDALVDTFFVRSIGGRVAGFEEGTNQRTLNEVATILADVVAPFPWIVGFVAILVAVWALHGRHEAAEHRPPARPDVVLPMAALLVTATLLYDLATRTLLPWYAFAFVPPIAAGLAWTIAAIVAGPRQGDAWSTIAATVGVIALGVGVVVSAGAFVSQLVLAGLVAGLVVVAAQGRMRDASRRRVVVLGAFALVAAGTLRDPEFRQGPDALASLMADLGRRDLDVVAVDRDTGATQEVAYAAYFGPGATSVRTPPWRRSVPGVQAYVTAAVPPEELGVRDGVELVRAPGAVALVGDVSDPPWAPDATDALLARGPITFEAEHLPSQRVETLDSDTSASGGMARSIAPFAGEAIGQFLVTHGPGWRLSPGAYRAEFRLQWSCPGRGIKVARLWVTAGRSDLAQVDLDCEDGNHDEWTDVAVPFRLERASAVELRVVYVAGSLAHDRTTVARID